MAGVDRRRRRRSRHLLSDVQMLVDDGQRHDGPVPTIFNDLGTATIRVEREEPGGRPPTRAQRGHAHALSRRLPPRRRPQHPGVDVPYGFDGGARRHHRRRRHGRRSASTSSATRPSSSRRCSNLRGFGGLSLHLDDRRDHVLRPRPERQRSHRSPAAWTSSSATSPTKISRSGTHIMRTTTFTCIARRCGTGRSGRLHRQGRRCAGAGRARRRSRTRSS